jgi:small nuclear ribonucleoprotein (snRNP)-like protein
MFLIIAFCGIVLCLVIGTLKGYDPLLNLVLDETEECLRGKRICLAPNNSNNM